MMQSRWYSIDEALPVDYEQVHCCKDPKDKKKIYFLRMRFYDHIQDPSELYEVLKKDDILYWFPTPFEKKKEIAKCP